MEGGTAVVYEKEGVGAGDTEGRMFWEGVGSGLSVLGFRAVWL